MRDLAKEGKLDEAKSMHFEIAALYGTSPQVI